MDNNINVTTHLADEDRALLISLGQELGRLIDLLTRRQARAEARKTATEAPKTSTPTEAPAEPETPATVETATRWDPIESFAQHTDAKAAAEKPTVKLTDIQRKIITLCQAGKKPAVTEIVHEYAESATQIPADKYGEVMDKLNALEG